jgi:hypothetical protein
MTNKSYINKIYYSFIKSFHQHDITVTCSNDVKARRGYERQAQLSTHITQRRNVECSPREFLNICIAYNCSVRASYIPIQTVYLIPKQHQNFDVSPEDTVQLIH